MIANVWRARSHERVKGGKAHCNYATMVRRHVREIILSRLAVSMQYTAKTEFFRTTTIHNNFCVCIRPIALWRAFFCHKSLCRASTRTHSFNGALGLQFIFSVFVVSAWKYAYCFLAYTNLSAMAAQRSRTYVVAPWRTKVWTFGILHGPPRVQSILIETCNVLQTIGM